jgi:hypothetical protein
MVKIIMMVSLVVQCISKWIVSDAGSENNVTVRLTEKTQRQNTISVLSLWGCNGEINYRSSFDKTWKIILNFHILFHSLC